MLREEVRGSGFVFCGTNGGFPNEVVRSLSRSEWDGHG